MSFLYPHLLYALIIPVLLAVAAWLIMRKRSRKWEILVSSAYAPELVRTSSSWKKILPLVFGILSLCFLIPALARPYSGEKKVEEVQKNHNIIIAIDCSRSMLAKDVLPSRLDRAKTAAYDLLDDLPEDKFGLIIFSGDAQLLMPLTHDHNSLRESIEQLEFGWVASGGTNLENVVTLAMQTFSRDKTKDSTNALVILSDGEDTVNARYDTAQKAKKIKLIVITAGIGTLHGDTIPDPRQPDGIYRDKNNQQIITKLDPQPLELLADETGGQYIQLANGKELTHYVKEIAERLDREETIGDQRIVPNDRFSVFAIPALICLILALITGTKWRRFSRKRKPTALAIFLLAIILPSTHAWGAELAPEARQLIQEGKWSEAEKNLNTLSQSPYSNHEEESRISFAKGYIGLKNAKEQEAKRNFSKALLSSDKEVQAAAHYNMGNATAQEAFSILAPKQGKQVETSAEAKAPQISDEQLKQAKDLLYNAINHYNDTLSVEKNYKPAFNNKQKLEAYLKEIEKEQQRREEEKKQQQDQNQQNKDEQNKQDQNQQNKDDQNKQDQNQQNKGDQNKQDQNQQDKGDQNKQDQNQQDKGDQNKQDQNQQDKGDQNKQDQNQQDKGDQNKQDQNQQDKGDQNKQDQNQQDKGDQNKQDQNQQDKGDQNKQDQNQQDKGDQNKQDQNQQDKGDQNKQDQKPQNPSPGNENQSNPDLTKTQGQENKADINQSSAQQNQQVQVAEVTESKEDLEKKEAARILKERMDAEKGSPIPQSPIQFIPEKDY